MFGVRHDGTETKKDFFSGRLWVETNQDTGFYYKRYRDLFATESCKLRDGYAIAERRLPVLHVSRFGRGKAVYLNHSPQRYLQYREEGTATDARRRPSMEEIFRAGVAPHVRVLSNGERPASTKAACIPGNTRITFPL